MLVGLSLDSRRPACNRFAPARSMTRILRESVKPCSMIAPPRQIHRRRALPIAGVTAHCASLKANSQRLSEMCVSGRAHQPADSASWRHRVVGQRSSAADPVVIQRGQTVAQQRRMAMPLHTSGGYSPCPCRHKPRSPEASFAPRYQTWRWPMV